MDKKGVSEVVAAVILIAIVASAGLAVVAVGLSGVNQNINVFSNQVSSSQQKLKERLTVDDVWFNVSSQAHISVYNYGKKEVVVAAVLINDTYTELSPQATVDTDEREWITVTFSWVSGGNYRVEVVSLSGYRYISYWKA